MNRETLQEWFRLTDQNRWSIFLETAERMLLHESSVEKDWWVVHTLSVIFSMDCASALIFKGGTSLSKGWNLIQRFSEDVDLALDREFLGFTGDLSKADIRKLRKKSYQFITEKFTEELKNKFTPISGIDYVNHSPDKIKIIPPDAIIKDWKRDYEAMTLTMIYGDWLSFDELIKRLAGLQKRINTMSQR